jgi:DNA-binding protein
VKQALSEKTEKSEPTKSSKPAERNTVFIGNKPSMRYVMAALFQLQQGGKDLVFKARGRAISRAVDVAEITRRRFMKDELKIKEIKIGTETVGEKEDQRNVSTIEITLERS